ncbi:hypothetical protein [Flammeovirga pacifica]|uniref:Uncharacterized protein n=1 Tax=Flammeovirga pacifica TaxID=915059 RepID=A0A1S1YU18_FLAPC|nr:hypothetical protein [Flammeovirga pacifica]OHX64496.1 hypothetical protein NH26_23240 [Flammeovirga pacifica]
MKNTILIMAILLISTFYVRAQDANDPIDPSPTGALFNRAYGDEYSKTQFLANLTIYDKWFFRLTVEEQFNYDSKNEFKGGNFMVSRLFNSKNEKHKYGFGVIASNFHNVGWAGGVNFVSVSKLLGGWKVITLTTLQGGDEIFTMEFQPGLYKNLKHNWYLRSHPRMLFDFNNSDKNEVPVGFGFGKIFSAGTDGLTKINLLFEPQYDFYQDTPMLYMGMKVLWN